MLHFLRLNSIHLAISAALAIASLGAYAQDAKDAKENTARPEVGNPLKVADQLVKSQKYREALVKVKEAEGVAGRNAYESFLVNSYLFSAALGSGEVDQAGKALDALSDSGRISAADKLKRIEGIISVLLSNKDYAKVLTWIARYQKEGGSNPAILVTTRIQSLYLNNEFAAAAKEQLAEIRNVEKGGGKPTQEQLQLLASAYTKLKDDAGYASVLEKYVTYYPKKEHWGDLLNRIERKPSFAQRLTLDLYRLMVETGNLNTAAENMEMAAMAMQAGLPSEAKMVIDKAFAEGIFGKGNDAERHKRLSDMVSKQVSEDLKNAKRNETEVLAHKDGSKLIDLGLEMIYAKQTEKGLEYVAQGLAKDNFARPDDAKLHVGIAYFAADQKAKAIQMLKTVKGTDGTAELARLWVLLAASK